MAFVKLHNPSAGVSTSTVSTGVISALTADEIYLIDWAAQFRAGASALDFWLSNDKTASNYEYGYTGLSVAAEGASNLSHTGTADKTSRFRGYLALVGGMPIVIGQTCGEGGPSSQVHGCSNPNLSSITEAEIVCQTANGFAAGTELCISRIASTPTHEASASTQTTSINVSSLSLTAESPYLVAIGGKNRASATSNKIYINSDTTDANYYSGYMRSDGTESEGSQGAEIQTGTSAFLFVGVLSVINSRVVLTGMAFGDGATGKAQSLGWRHDSATGVTAVNLVCGTTDGIEEGFIKLWKMD